MDGEAWFCASDDKGQLAGLSSALLDEEGGCSVDGFIRREKADSWSELIQSAVDWGADRKSSHIRATVSVEDEEKLSLYESAGFRSIGAGESFDLGGRDVSTLRMELA